ncbi:MAG: acyl carrier protein [Chloroflexi bacterium]|nr:acyl carrier protein [Chloroflexota bacterium]
MTHDAIVQDLRAFITREVLQQPNLRLDDDQRLISGGLLDSLALGRIAVYIEDHYGVYVPDLELTAAAMDTLSLMAERVRRP